MEAKTSGALPLGLSKNQHLALTQANDTIIRMFHSFESPCKARAFISPLLVVVHTLYPTGMRDALRAVYGSLDMEIPGEVEDIIVDDKPAVEYIRYYIELVFVVINHLSGGRNTDEEDDEVEPGNDCELETEDEYDAIVDNYKDEFKFLCDEFRRYLDRRTDLRKKIIPWDAIKPT